MTAASNSEAPPRISIPSTIRQFHQFDEGSSQVPWMDKGYPGSTASGTWLGVDEARSQTLQMAEGGFDRAHGVGNVMQTFTVLGQETTHRGFRAQRLEQLHEGPAHWNHRLLDPLFLDPLAIEGLDVVPVPITLDRPVEVLDGYRHMIQIEQFHSHQARAISCHGGPR